MKKFVIRKTGGPEVLEMVDAPDPEIGDGQVLIDVKAVGLNWSEVMIRRGEWPLDLGGGFTPGAEGAGIVEAVGPQVENVKPGDRVANFEVEAYLDPAQGNYAEKIAVPADKVLKFPERFSFAEAAASPMAILTAYDAMVNHSPLPETGTAVVTACTGAVGATAIQIAKRKGLRVIGTSRSKDKKGHITSLGAEAAIESDPVRLKERIAEMTGGGGVDYVFDPIAGETATQLLSLMNFNGTYVLYGFLGGQQFTVPSNILFEQIQIHGYVVLRNLYDTFWLQEVWSEVYPLLETREITVPISKTFPFEKAAEAHREMESHRHFGKLVLVR